MITGYDTKSLSTMNYINKTPHLFCKSAKNFVCHLILRVKTSTSLNKIYWLCVFKKHWLLVKIPWSPSWISTFSATGLFNIHSVVIDEQWFICNDIGFCLIAVTIAELVCYGRIECYLCQINLLSFCFGNNFLSRIQSTEKIK